MLHLEDIFVKQETLNIIFKCGGPVLVCAGIASLIFTKRYYFSITNDSTYKYYKNFKQFFHVGALTYIASLVVVLTDNLSCNGECFLWIMTMAFIVGSCLLYYSLMYLLDENKFPNISPNALYIVKPLLKNSWLWVKFAVILGSLLLLYKIGEWIFLKIW
jgi:hypothetical protein